MASKQKVFKEALDNFKKRLTDAEQRRFQSVITLDDLKREILARKYPRVLTKTSVLYNSIPGRYIHRLLGQYLPWVFGCW